MDSSRYRVTIDIAWNGVSVRIYDEETDEVLGEKLDMLAGEESDALAFAMEVIDAARGGGLPDGDVVTTTHEERAAAEQLAADQLRMSEDRLPFPKSGAPKEQWKNWCVQNGLPLVLANRMPMKTLREWARVKDGRA